MSTAETVTVTCPHCAQPLRALASHAGRHVRCPNLVCRQPVAVPLPLDDEPPAPAPAPKPRKPRRVEDDEPEPRPRAALWPWALAAVAGMLLVVVGAVGGWAFVATQDKPSGTKPVATAEPKNRQPPADNSKTQGQPGEPRPGPATPKGPKEPEPNPQPKPERAELPDDPPPRPPARPMPAAPEFRPPAPVRPNPWVPVRPQVPPPVDPAPPAKPADAKPADAKPADAKPADGAAAFVGTWTMHAQQLQNISAEIVLEFRADGKFEIRIDGMAPPNFNGGTWRWDGKKLHVESADAPKQGKPAEVKWNGPDEFVIHSDGQPVTLRRKDKAPRP